MSASIALVMTTYNSEDYLDRAIDSIIAQSYPDWHLTLWDDGSSDRSSDICRHYAALDERINFIAAPHTGRVTALADAIAAAPPHPYLAFVDSDDLLAPTALAETLAVFEQHLQIGVVYTNYLIIDIDDRVLGLGTRCQIPYSADRLLVDFISFHFRLLRREAFERVGGIDRDFRSAEDYDLCLKLSEITEFYHLERPLYYYRKHDLSISAVTKSEQTEYSAKAVNNALQRRGLTDRYRFLVAPTGQFHLQQRHPHHRSNTIPKIIHQTWKDENLPPRLAAFKQTWQERHPDWEYKLWTDTENREFLARFYPWFLPIYDRYEHNICRVDAIRYFWLDYYGGVYIDLDFECLASIDLLIAERSILLSLEPAAHSHDNDLARVRNLSEIISPAWMASAPEHPFWQHVWQHLIENRSNSNPLDATGPFLLTRAHQTFDRSAEIAMIPADRLHPISLAESQAGRLFDLNLRQHISTHALGIHHWCGSWWQNDDINPDPLTKNTQALVVEKNIDLFIANLNHPNYQKVAIDPLSQPLVSCLMVTKDRTELAKRSIFCFLQQTYPNKELVIIDNGNSPELVEFIRYLNHPQINYYRVSPADLTLGDFRNISIARANGNYLAVWDDDDLSDPVRLEIQMSAIKAFQVDFCLLDSVHIWWPHQQRLAKSFRRAWEGTIVCRKNIFPQYPSYQRGEDTELVESLMAGYRVAALNRPELYLYCCHDSNTWNADHFEHNWHVAQSHFEVDEYIKMMQQLELRLPIHNYLQSLRSISANNEVEIEIESHSLVSCLMVTKNRDRLAQVAIDCFLNQTYSNKQLVIIDDSDRDDLAEFIAKLNSPQIAYYRLPSQSLTLGELRNLAIAKATGSYIAQWDDDDLYHPDRLTVQMQAIVDYKLDACCLNSLYMWWPHQDRLVRSCQRLWECSLVCRKDIFPAYPKLRRGEDTEVVEFLTQNYRIGNLQQPGLYIYGIHQRNTWHAEHFEVHWQAASARYTDDNYHNLLANLAPSFPIDSYLKAVERSIERPQVGLNIAGCMDDGFGISEGVKYCLSALNSRKIPYSLHQIKGDQNSDRQHSVNLLHANPDSILDPQQQVLSSLGDRYFQNKYNIGYWVWESIEYFPSQWLQCFQLFNEIWTPSDYACAALSRVSPVPVVTIPHSIELPASPQFSRQELDLPVDRFIFLFIYDPLSLAVRKNPEGTIAAFKQAFSRTDDRVSLIIKTKGLDRQSRERLEALIDNYPQIEIIDEKYSRDRLNSLIYHCDCYISLHRAEGFGLTLAEAMFYGKPTIATGFSGNLDFMNDRNSLLVDYHPVRLDRDLSYFGAGTIWAEPNLDRASEYMCQVIDRPELSRQLGDRAARDIRSQLSPQAVGMKIQDRLQKYELN